MIIWVEADYGGDVWGDRVVCMLGGGLMFEHPRGDDDCLQMIIGIERHPIVPQDHSSDRWE